MTKEEALNKIKELENYIKTYDEKIGFEDDVLFLLSWEEYEKYKEMIPYIGISWWLRSPGYCDTRAVRVRGTCDAFSKNVFDIFGIRPALKFENLESKIICSKENPYRIIYKDFPFIIIDEDKKIAIAEVPIGFDMFDKTSNDYQNSYIRDWLEKW